MANVASISLKDMIVLVWAGLQKNHSDEVEEPSDAGEVIDEVLAHTGDLPALMDAIAEAVNDAVPMKERGGEGDSPNAGNRAARRSKGKKSAGTPASTGEDSSE